MNDASIVPPRRRQPPFSRPRRPSPITPSTIWDGPRGAAKAGNRSCVATTASTTFVARPAIATLSRTMAGLARLSDNRLPRLPRPRRSSVRHPIAIHGPATLCAALIATLFLIPRPLLLWNSSASSPRGLYLITSANHLRVGETIIAWPPQSARRLASARHYLPATVPLVKPVAASAGDRICASGNAIFVNDRLAVLRRVSDLAGRPMPRWSGCRRLGQGELFLLSNNAPLAFDGRYFGVTSISDVIGQARLLWAR